MDAIKFTVLFLIVVVSTVFAKFETDHCITAELKPGRCIVLQECRQIFDMANDLLTPMTPERLEFLIKSQCGFLGSNPKVCCPLVDAEDSDKEENSLHADACQKVNYL
ncbi:unnamed protein product [Acanthoscelides obtectus]|uniref:Clip domain-containing protein n=1 Tax=Acanthoscelides obtectus TaxID=200917 RepID=A0A9P0NSL7_ACAOB|nr:unnamed protein product [Acanthoscelides obtectus]CAK1678835.1 hypothetical protein AOBTE_LOCUS32038 [Acanthoscelides obtectus]